jgi:hypothetical protein
METTIGAIVLCEEYRFIDFMFEKDYVTISMLVANSEIY